MNLTVALSMITLGCLMLSTTLAAAADNSQVYYVLQTYQFTPEQATDTVDVYLKEAFLPAVKPHVAGPVGVFSHKNPEESKDIYVLLTFDSLEKYASLYEKLAGDEKYTSAAKEYLLAPKSKPVYNRMQTQIFKAFKNAPNLMLDAKALKNSDRYYEMRVYESHNEEYGRRKVAMFNDDEMNVFKEVGVDVVFYGENIASPHNPALTYMMVFESEAQQKATWDKFMNADSWKAIKDLPKYKDTVSKISKVLLVPKPYSQI